MTESEAIHRAEEAKTLLANDLFAEAMTEVRMDALMALSEVDPVNLKEIMRLQAIVHCTQGMRDFLEAAITRTGERDGGLTFSTPGIRPLARNEGT